MMFRNERGSILMLVVLFSIILSILGIVVLLITGQSQINMKNEYAALRALYLAEAGYERGRAYLFALNCFPENRPGHSADRIAFNPFGGDVTLEPAGIDRAGIYRVTITPDPSNDMTTSGRYLVESRGIVTENRTGAFDMMKVVRNTINISVTATPPITYEYRVKPNGWEEEPFERVVH